MRALALSLQAKVNSTINYEFFEEPVRPELVEGQSRTSSDEVETHHEDCGYMLRQAQHERFPGGLLFDFTGDLPCEIQT